MLDLQKIYEDASFKVASELQGYIGLYMKPVSFKSSQSKSIPRNTERGVGTLRLITGNLFRSFTPRKTSMGNIFQAKIQGENFSFIYGSSLAYSAIHEYGGIAGNGAKIPKRPYFGPAIREWKKTRMSAFKIEMKTEIIQEMKKWLANQKL
jgi:phage gpG-like protein